MTEAKPKGRKKTNLTTLCYIEQDGNYLMMHRVKKQHDINHDKWVGVGGHFEPDETPEECLLREVREETGLVLDAFRLRGIITFQSDRWQTEYMFLYTAHEFHGAFVGRDGCCEGTFEWVPKDEVSKLPIWEGDKIFFRLLEERQSVFSLKLRYVGDELVEKALDGRPLDASC
ncbi:MAG: 8-oxo-dGTP diphosphatase [Selenomonadaceae bacterium]|nr:8-oxo-dGTP diphosphatase [Selenomonadaceae bacterium]